MYRSSSSNKVSENLFSSSSSSYHHHNRNHSLSSSSSSLSTSASSPSLILRPSKSTSDLDGLPTFHPRSLSAQRQRTRLRFAESAVHLIPFLLIFCALLLWIFSKPESRFEFASQQL